MNNKAHTNYKTSKNKLVTLGVAWAVILLILVSTSKLTPLGLYGTLIVLLVITAFFLYLMRKTAKSALCSNCNADLFQLIEYSEHNKFNFKYCPQCGYGIDTQR